jgi:hypothetical protein
MRVSLLTRAGFAAAAAVIATASAMATAGAAGAAAAPRKPTPKPTYTATRGAGGQHPHMTVTPGSPSPTASPQKPAHPQKSPHPSVVATPQPTDLSIATKPVARHHRHLTLIAGQLTAGGVGLPGRVIFLDRETATGGLAVVGREHSGRDGGVAFVVSPRAATSFLLVFPGGRGFRASRSSVVTVKN